MAILQSNAQKKNPKKLARLLNSKIEKGTLHNKSTVTCQMQDSLFVQNENSQETSYKEK